MRRSKGIVLSDFSGGQNSNSPPTALDINQALYVDNIRPLSSGGFEARLGNAAFNASAMASGAAIHGLGYFKTSGGSDFLVAIADTALFKSDSLDGTMDTITGSLTITTGQNNIWTAASMNDLIIFVGGAPDAPIKWSGSGNGAVLGGSPPSGRFGIAANNRFFIGNTTSNPSRIAWSVLGDPEDWSGTGSGTQDVQKNDGDTLVGGSLLGVDHLILFKQHSIHDLIVTSSPFPLFPLFDNVGAISKNGIVQVDGLIYFITPEPRMKATDGTKIYDFSDAIDDVWDGLDKTRLQYIQGMYFPREHVIWWVCSSNGSSTHDICIEYNITHKSWWIHRSGFNMNVLTLAQDRTIYGGAYDGVIYKQEASGTYTDASEASAAVASSWQSGWIDFEDMLESKTIPYTDLSFLTSETGTFKYAYGYDFSSRRRTEGVSLMAPGSYWGQFQWGGGTWGGQANKTQFLQMKGYGKFFQYILEHSTGLDQFRFNRLAFPAKRQGVAAMGV